MMSFAVRYSPLIFFLFFLVSCEESDVVMMTGAAKDAVTAITLSDEDVRSLARRAAEVSDANHRVAESGNPYHARLQRLVAGYGTWDNNTYNFKVYLTRDVNAFAMADGTIRLYSGLMDLMSDEELLFVIGHEMGHVAKEHSRKKVVLAYASSAVRKGLASQNNEVGQLARSVVGGYAEQLANAQFSQHEERQADKYGVAFLAAGGYGKEAAVSALDKLAELARHHTFLSSHPDPSSRAKKILSADEGEKENRDSLLAGVFSYGKSVVLAIIGLAQVLLEWLLSLLSSLHSFRNVLTSVH